MNILGRAKIDHHIWVELFWSSQSRAERLDQLKFSWAVWVEHGLFIPRFSREWFFFGNSRSEPGQLQRTYHYTKSLCKNMARAFVGANNMHPVSLVRHKRKRSHFSSLLE